MQQESSVVNKTGVPEEITRIEPSAKKAFLFIGTSYGRILELRSENF